MYIYLNENEFYEITDILKKNSRKSKHTNKMGIVNKFLFCLYMYKEASNTFSFINNYA